MSMHRLSGCPSCAEPLEEGDRFCGVCGYALSSPPLTSASPPPAGPPAPAAQPAPAPTPAVQPAPAPAPRPAPSAQPAPVGGAAWGQDPAGPDNSTAWGTGSAEHPAPGAQPAPVGGVGWGQEPDPGGSGAAWGRVSAPHPTPDATPAGYPAARYGGGVPAPGWDGEPSAAAPGQGPGAAPYGAPPGGTPAGTPAPEAPYSAPAPEAGRRHDQPADAPQGNGRTCVACRAGHVDTDGYCEHCGHAQPRERDHQEEELGSVAAVSDRGLRHHRNEDSFAVAATAMPDGSAATVAIVCDGVSSASRPDEASAAAAGAANEALLEALPRGAHPQEAMHEAILAAASAVNALAPDVPGAQNAPACTLVGAVVSSGLLTIGWVGDSRAYWVPDDRAALPRRLTEDDSWAAQMVAAGLMGEAEAYADVRAHAITGWLGADAYDLEPHTASFKPDHPGVVVVCTDGLWNYAESARDMAQILPPDAATRPLHSAQVLVGHALDGGGHDNITVAVVPFTATPPEPSAAPRAEHEAEGEAEPAFPSPAEAEAEPRPRA